MHTCSPMHPGLTRRQALAGMAGALALGKTRLAFAASSGGGPRLVVLNILGGLDGLSAVIPFGDQGLAPLRSDLLPKKAPLWTDGFFGLDPNLVNLSSMFANGEALAVHAVGPIVDTRSHFLGQDFLQGGSTSLTSDGWLNRMLPLIGYTGPLQAGLALGASAPLAIRGAQPTAGWANNAFAGTNPNLLSVIQTAASNDPAISAAMTVAYQDLNTFQAILSGLGGGQDSPLVHLAKVAGLCLASPYGPQVAVIETESVDTHYDQTDRLPALLQDIDKAFAALKSSLGSAWASTVVLTMTEFGRTAYSNGTYGTDHGTGFAVFVAGGPVIGNRVVVNTPGWPSLQTNLYQGRDLNFTADFRQVAMGILMDHMGLSSSAVQMVFPNSSGLVPITGLVSG